MKTILQRGAGAAQLWPDVDLPGELADLDPAELLVWEEWHWRMDAAVDLDAAAAELAFICQEGGVCDGGL